MKVLIIGSRGMLGSMLANVFVDQKPTLWDREEIDITNSDATKERIKDLAPTIIINAAAYTNVDGAETDQATAFAVNEQGVANIATAAKAIGATVVHYSTDYVFAGDAEAGYAEDDTPGPACNIYGQSKLAGEQALQAQTSSFYLIRTAWLYGPNGKNFVETMLRLGQEKKSLQVVNDQYGSPTYTKDVAAATRALIDQSAAFGTYHLTNDGTTTWYDFAQHIFAAAHLEVEVSAVSSEEYPTAARRPRYSILKNTKQPALRPWQVALDEYLKTR